jgi:hypothetical protein
LSDEDKVTVHDLPGGYIAEGSWEDLMKFEIENQAAALAALLPAQRELLDGRAFCWFSYNGTIELAVFGESDSVEESQRKEKALSGPEDGPGFDYAEGRTRGYAFSTSYSTWDTRGELGDVHLLELVPIERSAFESARECGWDMSTLVQTYPAVFGYVTSVWNEAVVAKAYGREE